MQFIIDPLICEKIDHFPIGMIHDKNITISESPKLFKGRLQLFQESLFFDLENKSITELKNIKTWREIFKKTGKNPSRYHHSAEALYRRIQKGKYLSSIHSAIDINNFFSLLYQLPIGIYDVASINGSVITVTIGHEGQQYEGINRRMNSLQGLIITSDETGPFGSPFVDSLRTAVGAETTEAIQIVYLSPTFSITEGKEILEAMKNMFIQINGGEATTKLITCNN